MVPINSFWETKVLPSVTSQRSSIALWIWGSEGLLEKQEGMPWVEGAHRPPESTRCSDTTLFDLMDCSTPGFLVSHSLGACSDSCPLTWWCYLTISSGVAPFSSCLQSFLASGSFPMGWLFASGGQSIEALASVLPKNTQDWSTLGWTGWISLQSKGLSRVFSKSRLVVSNSLWPHESQHARPPYPSPTLGVCSNSCPLSRWCQPSNHLIFCCPLLPPSIFAIIFSNELVLCIRWPRYWGFSFSIMNPSNEYSGLISFRIDRLDVFAGQGPLKTLLQHYSSTAYRFFKTLRIELPYNPGIPVLGIYGEKMKMLIWKECSCSLQQYLE